MPPKLYMFRLPQGGFALTSDATGTSLPIDHGLGYTRGDWLFVATVYSAHLAAMITNPKRLEPELVQLGYCLVLPQEIVFNHRFWIQHAPALLD